MLNNAAARFNANFLLGRTGIKECHLLWMVSSHALNTPLRAYFVEVLRNIPPAFLCILFSSSLLVTNGFVWVCANCIFEVARMFSVLCRIPHSLALTTSLHDLEVSWLVSI